MEDFDYKVSDDSAVCGCKWADSSFLQLLDAIRQPPPRKAMEGPSAPNQEKTVKPHFPQTKLYLSSHIASCFGLQKKKEPHY